MLHRWHRGKGGNTPQLDQGPTVSSVQQSERHELTLEEVKEQLIMGVTKTHGAELSMVMAGTAKQRVFIPVSQDVVIM